MPRTDVGRDPLAFSTVGRHRVYEVLVKQIQDSIVNGKLKPGDKLPPERALAEQFHVSRSSVRDAIRSLQLMGLVRSRQGGGTTVCQVTPESVVAPLSRALFARDELVAELLEARKVIEPALAARAAELATTQEVAKLAAILERQREKTRRGEPIIEEDSDFHYTIALAARNTVVRRMVDLLMDLLRESRARGMRVPGRPQRSLAGHHRVLIAIRRRNPKAAHAAMLRHLREIEEVITGVRGS